MSDFLPLRGTRVLDFTMSWAGPWCTKILGDLGAEVIKIEAIQNYDLSRGPSGREDFRGYALRKSGLPPYERTDSFLKSNRNKLGITVNVKDPRGLAIIERLAPQCDIVAENFVPGDMERFGLGYARLRELRPDVIFLRLPAMGLEGPERDYLGFGTTLEMLSGITELTGYEGDQPLKSDFWYGDPVAGVHAAGAVLMAILQRDITGRGQLVEVAQIEPLENFVADALLQYQVNGNHYERMGNRDLKNEPQGCFATAEPDEWAVLSVRDEADWHALCGLLAQPAWVARWPGPAARRAHRPEIDAAIAAWVGARTRKAAVAELLAAGVPAAPVNINRDVYADPHLRARGFLEAVEHPVAGTYDYPASAFMVDGERLPTRRPAPTLGQHNREVLMGLAGVTEAELAELEAAQVIGNAPLVDVWGG